MQIVNQATSTVTLTSSSNPSVSFQPVTLTATVTPRFGGMATGTITFMDSTVMLAAVPVSGNTAIASISSLGAGSHSLRVVYGGDTNVAGSTSAALSQLVNKGSVTSSLTSSANPSFVDQTVTFTVTTSGQYGGPPTGSVTFRSGLSTLGTASLIGGTAAISTTFASVGTRNVSAVYSGDANYSSSTSGALAQVVTRVPTTTVATSSGTPTLVGQPVTFTATVSSSQGVPADGEIVTFRDRGTAIGMGTITGGVAVWTTSSLLTGSHSITARYPGDTNFSPSTSTAISQTVNKYATSTVVTSSLNPSTYGQPITFAATVTPIGLFPVTGNVAFRSGTTTLATVPLSSGIASFTTSSLTAGTKSITAVYTGDANNASSVSSVLTQTVNKAGTSTALASSPNPSNLGQTVTLSATVTSGAGIPAGFVVFRMGTTLIGTATLNSSGTAALTTSTLPRGNISISAIYSGSANFLNSSGSVVQTVN